MNKFFFFFLGIGAAFSALIFQTIATILLPSLANSASLEKIGFFMFLVIFIEEFVKFILLWKISQDPKKQKDIFWSAIILGSGFAVAEISLNILNNNLLDLNLFLSYLGLFLLHIFTTSIYGLYLSKKEKPPIWSNLTIFTLGYFFHFLFNFSIFLSLPQIHINYVLIFSILQIFYLNKKAFK